MVRFAPKLQEMRFRLLFLSIIYIYSTLCFAQTHDKVNLNTGFTKMVFYKMADGTKTTSSNTDWQMAFSCRSATFNNKAIQAASIRINGAFGTKLFLVNGKTKNDFNSVTDTAGLHLRQLVNQDTMWWDGAFNATRVPGAIFDYGWGQYDISTHLVSGDSLYLMQLSDGSYKKIVISYIQGDTAYYWNHANLNNSNLTNVVINKKTYRTKNYVYYDIQNNVIRDKEPAKTNWDLVFMQYQDAKNTAKNAIQRTGVLANDGVGIYKNTIKDLTNCSTVPYGSATNGIGQIWESFNSGIDFSGRTGKKYATNYYYIKDLSGATYIITFDDYYLSNVGEISFSYDKCWATGINETTTTAQFNIYPNPANDHFELQLGENETIESVCVFNIMGQKLTEVKASTSISVADLPEGIYPVYIVTSQRNFASKIIVKR